jgi:4-aminobutyrate aminotransferase-like enzyme
VEFCDEEAAAAIDAEFLSRRLFVRRTQGNAIRVLPALNITREELGEGLGILKQAIAAVADRQAR